MEGRLHIQAIICFVILSAISIKADLPKPLSGTLSYSSKLGTRFESGPIFLLDKRVILVTQFSYYNSKLKNIGNKYNKWFRGVVPTGSKDPLYITLEYDNGDEAQLTEKRYYGQNIYLKVPMSTEYDFTDMTEIGIFNEANISKSTVEIKSENMQELPEHIEDRLYKNEKFIFVYPKCCPLDSYASADGDCQLLDKPTPKRFPVHETKNKTYNTDIMTDIIYEGFYHKTSCEKVPFSSKDNNVNTTLLSDLQFLITDLEDSQIACMDFLDNPEEGLLEEMVFVCVGHLHIAGFGSGCRTTPQISVLLVVVIFLLSFFKVTK